METATQNVETTQTKKPFLSEEEQLDFERWMAEKEQSGSKPVDGYRTYPVE